MARPAARAALLTLSATVALFICSGPANAQSILPDTDWTIRSTFIGEDGEDIPLRIGRHDSPTRQGFGVRHIIDGHDEVPDEKDMAVVLSRSNSLCKFFAADSRYRCSMQLGDRWLFINFTEEPNGAPDGRPQGIGTAYYSPRGCPC